MGACCMAPRSGKGNWYKSAKVDPIVAYRFADALGRQLDDAPVEEGRPVVRGALLLEKGVRGLEGLGSDQVVVVHCSKQGCSIRV